MEQAGLFAVTAGADHPELAPAPVEVPRREAEALRPGFQPEDEVLAVHEDPVVVAGERFAGEKPGRGIQIDPVADSGGERGVFGGGHPAAELHQPLTLAGGGGGLRVVDFAVGIPERTEIGEEVEGDRLEEGGPFSAQGVAGPVAVGIFDHHVEPEQSTFPAVCERQEHPGERGAWGGYSGVAVELIAQRVGQEGSVGDQVMQVESSLAGERASGGALVEVEFERFFVIAQGVEERAIAFESDRDIGEGDATELGVPGRPGQVEAEDPGHAGPGGVRVAEDLGAIGAEPAGQTGDAAGLEGGPLVGGETEVRLPEVGGDEQLRGVLHVTGVEVGARVGVSGGRRGFAEFARGALPGDEGEEGLQEPGLAEEDGRGQGEADELQDDAPADDQEPQQDPQPKGATARGAGGRGGAGRDRGVRRWNGHGGYALGNLRTKTAGCQRAPKGKERAAAAPWGLRTSR